MTKNYLCLLTKRFAALVLLSILLFGGAPSSYVHAVGTPAPVRVKSQRTIGWHTLPAILARIKAPKFPARDFKITDYGASPGRETDSTEAIRKAIEACHVSGGGRVVVPPGALLQDIPV